MALTTAYQTVNHTADTATASPAQRTAAAIAMAGASGFVALVVVLHVLKPELDPSWRMVSEYEIGRHGWVMRLAFGCLAVACVGLLAALRGKVQGAAGRVGRIGLVAGAAGTALAGAFASDPITATKDQLTMQGNLHGLGFTLGVPGMLIAVGLVTRAVRRSQPTSGGPLRVTRAAVWASLAAFIGTMAVTYDGTFGPDVPAGWPNRLLVASFATWIITTARAARGGEPC